MLVGRDRNRYGTKMTPRTQMTLKNVPVALHRKLKSQAAQHHRSLNSEIVACLEKAVSVERVDVDELLARARATRTRVRGNLRDATISRLKRKGRP